MAQLTYDVLKNRFGFNDPNVINNILKNPGETARYQREYDAMMNPQPSNTSSSSLNSVDAGPFTPINNNQQEKINAFTTKFTDTFNNAKTAAEQELGLGTLRTNAQAASNAAGQVQTQVNNIAPTQQTIAKQVGISAPRLQQRIAVKTGELTPALQAAGIALEGANTALSQGETAYNNRINNALIPLTTEAGMISDALAREYTGFTQNVQNELQLRLEKIKQEGAADVANIQRATELAKLEQGYLNQRELVDLGNSKVLINPQSGKQIASYNKIGTLDTGW